MTSEGDALDRLAARLQEAVDTFAGPDQSDEEGPNQPRKGVADALDAVLDYLHDVGTDHRLWTPLQALLAALGDADNGIRNRLLVPAKSAGARTPIKEALDLAMASVAVTLFMDIGMTKRDACTKVAVRLGEPAMTAKELGYWRDHLRQEKQRPEALAFYNTSLKEAKAGDPHKAAQNALDFVREKTAKSH